MADWDFHAIRIAPMTQQPNERLLPPEVAFLLKIIVAIVLVFIASVKIGPTWDNWPVVVLAGVSGMLWQSAFDQLRSKP